MNIYRRPISGSYFCILSTIDRKDSRDFTITSRGKTVITHEDTDHQRSCVPPSYVPTTRVPIYSAHPPTDDYLNHPHSTRCRQYSRCKFNFIGVGARERGENCVFLVLSVGSTFANEDHLLSIDTFDLQSISLSRYIFYIKLLKQNIALIR